MLSMDLQYNRLRNIVFLLFVLRHVRKTYYSLRGHGVVGSIRNVYFAVRLFLYSIFLRTPGVRGQVNKQVATAIEGLENKLVASGPGVTRFLTLPKEGWTPDQTRAELDKLADMEHTRWEDGRVSGAVYHGGKDLLELQTEAFGRFTVTNPIHPDVFPGVRKMEAEVVAMVCVPDSMHSCNDCLFSIGSVIVQRSRGWCWCDYQRWYRVHSHGLSGCPAEGICGARSNGAGDVSWLVLVGCCSWDMANWLRIIPDTAHAAFYKASNYFGIKLHRVPCPAPDYKVDVPAVRRLINPNTVLLVGSAPNFPHGIVDDIPALSRVATTYKIPLHVDCCLGSFIIAFLKKAGFPSPYEEEGGFDFRLPGVTSISVDTHKYGFAPKGNSVVLYRNRVYRSYQYFIYPDWAGGVYASPSVAGSRPGALIAGCWTSLMSIGESGYVNSCSEIVSAANKLEASIREHPVLSKNLDVVGKPMVSVVAFYSKNAGVDTYDIADDLSSMGWHLNALQSPSAIHIAFTVPTAAAVDKLTADIIEVVQKQLENAEERKRQGKSYVRQRGDTAALYGVAGSMPDKSIVSRLAEGFLDTLYKA